MGSVRGRYRRSVWALGPACIAVLACDGSDPAPDESTTLAATLKAVELAPGVSELAVPEGETVRVSCEGSEIPRARYDGELAARSEADRHARVCASRRYLLEHMTPALRSNYRGLLDACP